MKFTKTTCLLFLVFSLNAFSVPLDFECDQPPGPLKIDCPNDEFFSLGYYPGNNISNPENYSVHYQWAADYMNFAKGWYYTKGTSRLSVFESDGFDIYNTESNKNIRKHSVGAFSLKNNSCTVNSLSGNDVIEACTSTNNPYCRDCTITEKFEQTNFSSQIFTASNEVHGQLIMSILGNNSNNSVGTSGLCIDCSLSFVFAIGITPRINIYSPNGTPPNDPFDNCNNTNTTAIGFGCLHEALDAQLNPEENAFNYLISSGSQIIDMSLTLSDKLSLNGNFLSSFDQDNRKTYPSCNEQLPLYGYQQEFCSILQSAKLKDIVVVVSAGNDNKYKMAWPANDENVIGVVGTNPLGELWERNSCFNVNNENECGTNFDSTKSKFAAPAENILVYHPNGDYNIGTGCADSNFFPSNDGYQRCSGTSFSAPVFASVAAMIRSINPLLPVDDVKQVLWDSRVEGLADQRYAIPQADKSVTITLGKSNNTQIVNRLTPMFRMKTIGEHNYPNQVSYLSTTIPQIGTAARLGTYLVKPRENTGKINFQDKVTYKSDTNSPLVQGYAKFKGTSESARAPFYVFGGHRNPFNNEADDLLPLHHMVRSEFFGGPNNTWCSELADHAYSTSRNNGLALNNFCNFYYGQLYLWEGIEGYILPSCPNGVDCFETTNNANDAQCLKVRYSTQDSSFALMMASEINEPMFQSYGTKYKNGSGDLVSITSLGNMENAECLGYVFPNIDSDNDGLIDGMESVLGTNPNIADTDGDTINDGDEYPLSGIPLSDPLEFIAPPEPCYTKICTNN